MTHVDEPICKESHVVLQSPENTTRDILAKTGSYSSQRYYITL